MNTKAFIGIDVGGTKIYGGIVTPSGEIIISRKMPTPPKANAREIIAAIGKVVKDMTKEARFSLKDILGIGIAIPGIVDNNGKIVITPNLNLSNIDLKKVLTKKFKTKIMIGNDVNLGVLGEKWLGAGRKAKNIVGVFPGTGVGGGVIVNGEFIAGTQGAAAELGHMIVDPNGPICTCGNKGCLEAVAGRWAMERDLRAAVKKGQKTILTELAGPSLKQVRSSTIAKALKAKDPLATKVMTSAVDALGKACVSLNHIFNPEIFLFGGGVVEACGDFILPRIEQALKQDPFFAKLSTPRVVQSKLGDDAVVLGAVAAVRRGFDLKNSSYYPAVKLTPSGKVSIKGKIFHMPVYIRADGKLKNPKDFIPNTLTDEHLDDFCKKGPDVFIVARGKGKTVEFSPKALRFLRKKRIIPHVLPIAKAIQFFNKTEERKAILFYI